MDQQIKFYSIKSNREAGLGRYDLVLIPKKNQHAYIIEFKAVYDGDFNKTIKNAFKQINDKKYEIELKEYNVTKIVIAFKGKEVEIETRKQKKNTKIFLLFFSIV